MADGHARKGEKSTPALYVACNRRKTVRDERGEPRRDDAGHPLGESVWRERPLVKLHYVPMSSRPKDAASGRSRPQPRRGKGPSRPMRGSGIRIDHVAGGRACCRLAEARVGRPERSRFASQGAFTHTALHELGHAPGPPSRLNRPTLVAHGGKQAEGARGRAAAPRRDTGSSR